MGTRGAWGFYKNGKTKATYNHFDSYPSGLGVDILDFVKGETVESLNGIFDKLELVDTNKKPTDEQIEKCKIAKTIDLGVSERSTSDWYCLLRGCQGDPAAIAKLGMMSDGESFLGDGLFCEYAYIINLDENVLEVYEGFKEANGKGRYQAMRRDDEGEYLPVSLVGKLDMGSLPEDMGQFEQDEE